MTDKTIKTAVKLLIVLIIIINQFLKPEVIIDSNIVEANIDGGYILMILTGLSFCGYKLYKQDINQ